MSQKTKWQLVIFDCDGVLVDSEPIANRIFAQMLTEIGLPISYEETVRQFVGRSLASCMEIVEQSLGKPAPDGFIKTLETRLFEAFEQELQPIPGITDALNRISLPVCVASSGDHTKMQTTLGLTGLLSRFQGKLFSATEVERGKPYPDLFLHAACRMMVAPEFCAVIEDTVRGVQAGVAAGMTVFGYARLSTPSALSASGAKLVFDDMSRLPELLLETG